METALDYENELKSHVQQERAAVKLSSIVGELLYDQGIELVFFRNHLNDVTVAEVLKLHVYSKSVVGKPVDIFSSVELAELIKGMDLAPAKMDIGKLASEWITQKEGYASAQEFLNEANKLGEPSNFKENIDEVKELLEDALEKYDYCHGEALKVVQTHRLNVVIKKRTNCYGLLRRIAFENGD